MSKDARNRLEAALDAAPETEQAASGSAFTDFARAGAQGLSFGFADEIEAAVTTAFDSGKTYAEVVKDVRGQIESFRQRNPAAAYSTEIAGAILPTIAAQFIPGVGQVATAGRAQQLAKAAGFGFLGPKGLRTAQVAGTSGAQSALYGAGAAEGDVIDRLPSAVTSGVIGAVAGPVVDKVAPAITAKASELIKKGVALTPGQAVGGSSLLGTALQRTEERVADTVPLLGDAVRGAFDRATGGFNRAAVTEALEPLAVKVPKNLEGDSLIAFGDEVLRTAYDRTLSKMKIKNVLPLATELDTLTKDLADDIANDVKSRVTRNIIKKFKNGEMTGKDIKNAQMFLRTDIKNLRTKTPTDVSIRTAEALEDVKNVFSAELQKQNPVQGPILNSIDKSYGNFKIVEGAAIRRTQDEAFLPSDLLQASKKSDIGRNKTKFATGQARMQRLGRTAQEVMGNRTPNSGTAARLSPTGLGIASAGGGVLAQAEPFTIGATLASPLAYTSAGVPIARNLVAGAGKGMRAAVPVAAANTTEMSRQMLADILRR